MIICLMLAFPLNSKSHGDRGKSVPLAVASLSHGIQ